MRILLSLHHRLTPDAGAPAATMALGKALTALGCSVRYLSFDRFFRRAGTERLRHQVLFPWLVAGQLASLMTQFEIVDASTGDLWVWALLLGWASERPAIVTRSHGLEHVADATARQLAANGGPPLSWKYPLYHGGLRLWEVRRSLAAAEQSIVLNSTDRDYAHACLGIPESRLTVVPNGIADHFHSVPPPQRLDGPLAIAFVGRWTSYKGRQTLVEAMQRLDEAGVPFDLRLLGTHDDAALADFPNRLHDRVSVLPRFANTELPDLLADRHAFVLPSVSEGWSGSLAEAMACGLVPVATRVGAAADVVEEGVNGHLVPVGDGAAIARALTALDADRARMTRMREAAHETAKQFRWSTIAERTLAVYRAALATRAATVMSS
jgi:glycosyltransferase involved in cell wall biosynthesis